MRWVVYSSREGTEAGERFRREHEAWLTWASASSPRLPIIPLRRVESGGGGYEAMMSRESGRRRAERWWRLAFARVPARPKGLGHD